MNMLIAIFLGGGAGSLARHYSVAGATKLLGEGFPYGTLFVNVLGSLVIGVLVEGFALKWQVSPETRALLVTGFLGGFTTFSAFSLDFYKLAETGNAMSAVVYAASSFVLSLVAVFAGVYIAKGVLA